MYNPKASSDTREQLLAVELWGNLPSFQNSSEGLLEASEMTLNLPGTSWDQLDLFPGVAPLIFFTKKE